MQFTTNYELKKLKRKMKKVMRCMCMMAIVALAFTSCKKNEQKSTFVASTQQLTVQAEDDDRAYIADNMKIMFEEGDMCMQFNISVATPTQSHAALYVAQEGGQHVSFENAGLGEIAEDILDGYYAFYPGGPGHTITELGQGENKCKFYIAPEQEYRENKVGANAMYMAARVLPDEAAHLSDVQFQFKNICGVLRLKPYEAAKRTVTSIEIVDNAFDLSGWCELIIPEVDGEEMQSFFNNFDMSNPTYVAELNAYLNRLGYNMTEKGNSITLNIPGGVQLGDSKANTPAFNIVLRPLAMSQGCHIILTFADGSTKDMDLSAYNLMQKPNVVKPVNINCDNF